MASHEMDTSADLEGESVTSTRSHSYISNAGSARSSYPAATSDAPRNTHNNNPPTRRRFRRDPREEAELYKRVMQEMRRRGLPTRLQPQKRASDGVMVYPAGSDSDSDMDVENENEVKVEAEDEDTKGEQESLPSSVANSLLFSLPREIRDRIYGLCLHARDSLPIEWPRLESHLRHHPYHMQPQLLRTCRIVHSEAAPLLYTLNHLTFHHPSDGNIFVCALSDTTFSRRITGLSLHIKSGDIRMWMTYLMSTDPHRSLRHDFPSLRDLGLRYRSSRWNPRDSPEHNLQSWIDDPRLDELIDGVRGVYRPYWCTLQEETLRAESELELSGFDPSNNYPEPKFTTKEETRIARERYFELRHARLERARQKDMAPTIRVCCACRVHPSHFQYLTEPSVAFQFHDQGGRTSAGILPDAPPAARLVEGSDFPERGFSPINLQRDVKNLYEPGLGSAVVSRTPYVVRKGVLLALEISSVDVRWA